MPLEAVKVKVDLFQLPMTTSCDPLMTTAPPMALFAWPQFTAAVCAAAVPLERVSAPAMAAASASNCVRAPSSGRSPRQGDHPDHHGIIKKAASGKIARADPYAAWAARLLSPFGRWAN